MGVVAGKGTFPNDVIFFGVGGGSPQVILTSSGRGVAYDVRGMGGVESSGVWCGLL